jgi:hypothetical protein
MTKKRREPDSTIAILDRLREKLHAAPLDERAFHELPRWIPHGLAAEPGSPGPEVVRDLREILRQPGPAERRALAVLWLTARALPEIEDLDALFHLREKDSGKVRLPAWSMSQAISPEIPWESLRLSRLADEWLVKLTGRSFDCGASYVVWKTSAPDPCATFALWRLALRRPRTGEEKAKLLKTMESRDLKLATRLLILCEEHEIPVPADEVVGRVCAVYDPAALWRFHTGEESWGDPADPELRRRFGAWLTRHASRIYADAGDPGFLEAWERSGREDSGLATAAAALHRTRSAEILKATLDRGSTGGSDHPLLCALIRHHYPDEWPYVRDRFWDHWTRMPDHRPVNVFLRALAEHPQGRPALRELVTDGRFDDASQWDLEGLIRALEPIVVFPRLDQVWLRKNYRNAGPQETARLEERAREAARDCLAHARKALSHGLPPTLDRAGGGT